MRHPKALAPYRPSLSMPLTQLSLDWRGRHKALTALRTVVSHHSSKYLYLNPTTSLLLSLQPTTAATTGIYHPSPFINSAHPQRPRWYSLLCPSEGRLYPHGPLGLCRHQKSPKNSSARTATVDKPRWSCVPREASKLMALILVAKKQLCKVRNCQQSTMRLRPSWSQPVANGLRWGGEGKGQHRITKRSINEAPVWGCGHFSWGRIQSP